MSFFVAASLLMTGNLAAAVEVTGKLQSATIFRSGAELTHNAKAQLVSGTNDVVVEGLSSMLEKNSITIKCSNGVTVVSFDYSKDYVKIKTQGDAVKKLRDSVDIYSLEIEKMQAQTVTAQNMQKILLANMTSAGSEKAPLSSTELPKLVDYYKTKSLELGNELITLKKGIEKRKERVDVLEKQIRQDEGLTGQPIGKLNLKLAAPLAGSCDISVTYFTNFAFWSPLYDIQASGSDKPLKLISKAKFTQSTGIDWQKAKITLSTAVPSRGRTAPVINAWFISPTPPVAYSRAPAPMMMEMADMAVAQNSISYKEQGVNIAIRGAGSLEGKNPLYVVDGRVVSDREMNDLNPQMIESIEILKDASATSIYGSRGANGVVLITTKKSFVTEGETEAAETTYALDLPYDLLANGSEHTVTLRTVDIPAAFEYYCVPKLDRNVFLLAGIKDWAQYNLLPGQASITYDGTYAGKTVIDPGSTKEVLHLTMGEDKRVAVSREKLQQFSSTKFIGNNKKQTFSYKLTVKNNKPIDIQMILKEQYPISTDKSIVVELTETDSAHNNPEVGSLTWEFPLKAGESRSFKVTYSINAPKDFVLY